MNDLQKECFNTIAQHYATKIKAQNINATQDEINAAIQANWDTISEQISTLYAKVLEIL